MSSSPKAKFAPRSPRPPSAFTEAERHAFVFAEEVSGLAVGIVDAAIAEVVFEGEKTRKLWPRAPLSVDLQFPRRSDDGASRPSGGVPHAGPLLLREPVSDRPTFKHGAKFVKTMRSHDAASRISLGESGSSIGRCRKPAGQNRSRADQTRAPQVTEEIEGQRDSQGRYEKIIRPIRCFPTTRRMRRSPR